MIPSERKKIICIINNIYDMLKREKYEYDR